MPKQKKLSKKEQKQFDEDVAAATNDLGQILSRYNLGLQMFLNYDRASVTPNLRMVRVESEEGTPDYPAPYPLDESKS